MFYSNFISSSNCLALFSYSIYNGILSCDWVLWLIIIYSLFILFYSMFFKFYSICLLFSAIIEALSLYILMRLSYSSIFRILSSSACFIYFFLLNYLCSSVHFLTFSSIYLLLFSLSSFSCLIYSCLSFMMRCFSFLNASSSSKSSLFNDDIYFCMRSLLDLVSVYC